MRRRRHQQQTPQPADHAAGELYRAPIITEHLIIREAARSDADDLERTMDAAHFETGERTTDGARRFGDGMAEVPMWSATRAVCEKGSARIVGGIVITQVPHESHDVRRIGWWLQPDEEHYGLELVTAALERLQTTGANRAVMHIRTTDAEKLRVAEAAGFRQGETVHHTTTAGQDLEFWEYMFP